MIWIMLGLRSWPNWESQVLHVVTNPVQLTAGIWAIVPAIPRKSVDNTFIETSIHIGDG